MSTPKNSRSVALGRAITQLRGERNLTVADVARGARLRPIYVQLVEEAEIGVSYLVMCRLADALGVAPHELIALAHELPDAPEESHP
jgi:transcriptional regulator with XRE-family HTH domain